MILNPTTRVRIPSGGQYTKALITAQGLPEPLSLARDQLHTYIHNKIIIIKMLKGWVFIVYST